METNRINSAWSSGALRETLAALGVIASLTFVGIQIRASNIQARAAAYQGIGIATSEYHRSFNARMNRLVTESTYPEAVQRWTLEDWETMQRLYVADLRMLETILLQVEQGLLPPDAMQRLGYNWSSELGNPAIACLWPEVQAGVGPSVRRSVEDSTPERDRVACKVDLKALRDETVLGTKG